MHCARAMKETFGRMDVNGDGRIDRNEFHEAMIEFRIPIGLKEIDILFSVYDADQNGTIDYGEWLQLIQFQSKEEISSIMKDIKDTLLYEMGPGAHHGYAMKKMFETMDKDCDGCIDQRELASALRNLNVPIGDSQIRMIFEVYDTNRSGSLDYNEFLNLLGYESHDG